MKLNNDTGKKLDGVKLIQHVFDGKEIKIIPFGDWHLGYPTCNLKKIKGTIDYIKESNSKVILMGDLMEAGSKHSIAASWIDQEMAPQTQLETLEELLTPIKDNILVILEGNHEFRIYQETGIKVAKILAKSLGVPYGGYSCFIRVRNDKYSYLIYAQHGNTSSRYPHTKMAACIRTSQHTEADIYLYAHTHELADLATIYRYYDSKAKIIEQKKRYFILTGHFLEYYGSYAERKDYNPGKTGVAKIKLFGDRWDIHVST